MCHVLAAASSGVADEDGEDFAVCPKGHILKEEMADDEFQCDMCGKDISSGLKIYDCRECDYTICPECKAKREDDEAEQIVVAIAKLQALMADNASFHELCEQAIRSAAQ